MHRILVVFALVILNSVHAFISSSTVGFTQRSKTFSRAPIRMAVIEIDSEEALDKTVALAGPNLVVVDYSTTWCGPCKVIDPKYRDLSEQYKKVIFLKVIGDSTADASKLMKREGVRSVPSFHFWKDGQKVDQVNGANSTALEAAVRELA